MIRFYLAGEPAADPVAEIGDREATGENEE
jgi:hypothetical protein